ncbi:thiamine biosynthesis lipoprotein [Arthrobacter sp. PvP023]|uniref:FAD:protein FMN transferase n=1 Tax=Micrococcaceae TaxID=1268 RepID=UPI001AE6DC7E|nr:FAD:protein FMN transferase [Arthrobacter sp. PvP023]MBP1135715.1 thiamine biosynthesis lipoprotein [Arthrobacter sp. PvP023]
MPHPGWAAFSFDGIGTSWEISTPGALDGSQRRRLLDALERYDAAWSRFRPDSIVAQAAREPGRFRMPDGAGALGRLYRSLYRLTDGAMTPLIGGSLEQLGYDPDYSLRQRGIPLPAPRWEEVLDWQDTVVTTSAPVVLDVGAAGKGQLADLLATELRSQGITEYFIDASGDLLNSGPVPVSVGLEHPYDPGRAIGTISLGTGALCASAANRRAWGDGLHHVLDGTTGTPVKKVVTTWALAGNAMTADALATALFFVSGQALEQDFDFSWLTVFSDGSAAYSAGFEGVLFE